MNKKKLIIILFMFVAVAQMYIPLKMILDRENILEAGKEFKFKTAPIDPNDPFRGKYIYLSFQENEVEVENIKDWQTNELVYAILEQDNEGFAKIRALSKDKPTDGDFLRINIGYIYNNDSNKVFVEYPFNTYYMEETLAPKAEEVYFESARDTTSISYALVNILHGEAVLKDVLIDGEPIAEIVKRGLQKNDPMEN